MTAITISLSTIEAPQDGIIRVVVSAKLPWPGGKMEGSTISHIDSSHLVTAEMLKSAKRIALSDLTAQLVEEGYL